jgi:hypothetical protein
MGGKILKHKRIIVWGFKHNSHTHHYIHLGYSIGFKALGYETHWIDGHDSYDPALFNDALIFTEQWAVLSHPIPLNPTSTYAVHYLGNKNNFVEGNPGPSFYLGRVGRLIDVRYNANKWNDKNYVYELDRNRLTKIGSGSYYEKGDTYDNFYTVWATNLLPEEINLEDRFTQRENYIYFGGTIGGGQGGPDNCLPVREEWDNRIFMRPFINAAKENNIEFKYDCPWVSPTSMEAHRELVKKAYLAPDFRHKDALERGYIPCRYFKNISYGQLGVTNSKAVYDFSDGNVVYNSDTHQLFYDAQKQKENFDLIKSQMLYIRENHTFINRCKELLEVVNNG